MPSSQLYRRVMNRPEDLIELVSQVDGYPKFINLLSAVRITNRKKLSDHIETFEAEATVSYKFVRENFNSLVKVDHENNTIDVTKATRGGAVKSLANNWVFHELSDGSTLVEFFVDVRLKAFPLELLLRDKFDKAADHMIRIFETRAKRVYGNVGEKDLDLAAEYARLGIDENIV